MNKILRCNSHSLAKSYEIQIEHGLLNNGKQLASYLSSIGTRAAIVTDATVAKLYGDHLCRALLSQGLETALFSFPSGEKYKNRATKSHIEDQMFDYGLGRDTVLIALGGGVVSDLSGYIASTYCRGIPLVLIPTTLLAMVDACIGGKNGIDVPQGKNLLGTIYPPHKVLIDPSTLKSLPQQDIVDGAVEMLKHGLIADKDYFNRLLNSADKILSLHPETLEQSILDSCRIKKDIVEHDEHETGKRRLLNLGHTIGHALEKLSHYSLSHGQAIAIGIMVESHMGVQMGHLSQNTLNHLLHTLKTFKLPFNLPTQYSLSEVTQSLRLDKKSQRVSPRFAMIEDIGVPMSFHGAYCTTVEERYVKNSVEWMHHDLCRH